MASKTLQWRIGEVTVTSVVELQAPGLSFVLADAVPENLKAISWLAPHFVDAEWEAIAAIQTFVVESQGKRIVVDTCIGNDKNLRMRRWARRKGPFLEDLSARGFDRKSIDLVLCTHLHVDHVGWNTMLVEDKWIPTFPNARYLFGRLEWEHWNQTQDSWVRTILEESVQPILDAGLHTLVETDHRITDEIWLEPTPGHTPGHVSVRIASKGEEAVITGDLMHHPCQIARTHWNSVLDSDPQQAIATRRNFVASHAQRGDLVIGTHFPAPTAGRIVRDGDGFKLQVS
jgi:glyoxylase-like metal-dependent hydrolase (beta-lactamase superfamily II)